MTSTSIPSDGWRLEADGAIAEECRRLRRLQRFRKSNACVLMTLASPHQPTSILPGVSDGTASIAARHGQDGKGSGLKSTLGSRDSPVSERITVVPYRLTHFLCSYTPTVSCLRLEHARPGYPSDAPPLVSVRHEGAIECGENMDVKANMLTPRLLIPNSSSTSIRSDKISRRSTTLPTEKRGPDKGSLSIVLQCENR